MLLVAELGFLGIFIGGGITYDVPDPNTATQIIITTEGMPELGQMIADFWAKIIQTPWVPFLVGSLIFLQIFAFNLLGEGLRRHMDITQPRGSFLRTLLGWRARPAPPAEEMEPQAA